MKYTFALKTACLILFIAPSISISKSLTDSLGAAPLGNPIEISNNEIKKSGHPYPKLESASRNQDGSISATCSNKEDYRIFSLEGEAIVMRCSAVREMGISGC